MHRLRLVVLPLRVLLALAFALLVLLQTFSFPGQFAHMAQESPDLAPLRWPMTAFAAVELLCVEVVLVCTWKLLGMVRDDRIFTTDALPWVDRIVGAIGTAWVLLTGLFLFVGFTADDPGAPLLLFLLVVAGAVFGLLMLVMRDLLSRATSLRSDLEAVI